MKAEHRRDCRRSDPAYGALTGELTDLPHELQAPSTAGPYRLRVARNITIISDKEHSPCPLSKPFELE